MKKRNSKSKDMLTIPLIVFLELLNTAMHFPYSITLFLVRRLNMGKVELILTIACFVIMALGSLIPTIFTIRSKVKAVATATTEAEKQKAINDLLEQALQLVVQVEKAYDGVNKALKAQGDSAGALKKDSVLAKLQAYAINAGYTFDSEYWSTKIDELIAVTNNVNV